MMQTHPGPALLLGGAASNDLAVSASRLQVVRYMAVVSVALLAIEWIALFADEVELIWKSKWSFVKILYLISRYMPFVDAAMIVAYNLKIDITPEYCSLNDQISLYVAAVGLAISELILLWRTWAIWDNSKKVIVAMVTAWIAWVVVNTLIFTKLSGTLTFDPAIIPGNPGCHTESASKTAVLISYCTLVAEEAIVVIMTLIKGVEHIKGSRDPMVKVLYRDGILFYAILLSLCIGNVIQLVTAPIEYLDVLDNFISVVHRVLCCRVLLNLRAAAQDMSSSSTDEQDEVSSLDFQAASTTRTAVTPVVTDIEYGQSQSFALATIKE